MFQLKNTYSDNKLSYKYKLIDNILQLGTQKEQYNFDIIDEL